MSRRKDLLGVLKTVKTVGKKVAKVKKNDLDHLVRGTTLKETVDGVALTFNRIVKAVDEIQKAGRTKDGFPPGKRRTDGKEVEQTSRKDIDDLGSNINDPKGRTGSKFSLIATTNSSWHSRQGVPSLTSTSNVTLIPPAFVLTGAFPITRMANDFVRRSVIATTIFPQTRFLSSTSALLKDGDAGSGKGPTVKAPPTAADIKRRLKAKPKLPASAKENRVPTGRIERLASFSGLAAGLALGAGVELTKRAVGISENRPEKTLADSFIDTTVLLNPANAERIVDTLCRVRGAALKLGQMLSIADNDILPAELSAIFERVRQSADFMPWKQTQKQLVDQLGPDWRSKFADFSEKPFAAASIGQVHSAQLLDGTNVAVKIQYPGVAEGIDSDLNNLVTLMNATKIFPDNLFLEEIVRVARKELAWEVDYFREAAAYKYFGEIMGDDPIFFVPKVYDEVSGARILTTEMVDGVSLEQACDLDSQDMRNRIGEAIFRLTLNELFVWRVMQTDPNWSNFLYCVDNERIGLIDFGANRFFSTEFVDNYIQIINSAANGDRQGIIDWSQKVGFLTGYESKNMMDAHAESVMILGEGFQKNEPLDFASQTMIKRVAEIVPAVLKERLRAPPEEVYSVHRKLGGVFLLCTRLKCRMPIYHLWQDIWNNYEFDRADLKEALTQYEESDPHSVSGK